MDINGLADITLPLATSIFGTAFGALIVTYLNNDNEEYKLKQNKVINANLALAMALVHHHNFYRNFIYFKNEIDKFKINRHMLCRFLDGSEPAPPPVNIKQTSLFHIDLPDFKKTVALASNNPKVISYAVQFAEVVNEINDLQKSLNTKFIELTAIRTQNTEAAIRLFYGIISENQKDTLIIDTFEQLFTCHKVCTLILDEIIKEVHIENKNEIHEYEVHNFKRLPNLIIANIDKTRNSIEYPKNNELRIFDLFK